MATFISELTTLSLPEQCKKSFQRQGQRPAEECAEETVSEAERE